MLRRSCQRRIYRLLEASTTERGFTEDKALNDDLSEIIVQRTKAMRDTHPPGSFARIFWDSQQTLQDSRQMRWDPLMV